MSDQSLERAVMTAIADNDLVHADELAVEVHGDYVILRGTVGSLMQRAEALRTARRVPGVDAVDALVHVRPLGANGLADADTEAAVMAALIDDGGVPASSIEVDAHGDAVTLSGLVDARSQRDRAKRIALRVGGVAQVHNELRVLSIVSPDEVAERVTDAIGVDGADRRRPDLGRCTRQRRHPERHRGLARPPRSSARGGRPRSRRHVRARRADRARTLVRAAASFKTRAVSGATATGIGRRAPVAQAIACQNSRGERDEASHHRAVDPKVPAAPQAPPLRPPIPWPPRASSPASVGLRRRPIEPPPPCGISRQIASSASSDRSRWSWRPACRGTPSASRSG